MNKLYSMLLLVLCGLVLPAGAQVLEDFETLPLKLKFNDGIGDGVYEGRVKNPDSTNAVNKSRWVGKYTKDSTAGFSLLIANLLADTKLTAVNNQLFVDIYASGDTRVLAKVEGTGPAIESALNIPVAGQWRTYRFDLSKATDASTFTKLIFFFDFGNDKGKGTYYIDNIRLGSDACAGTVRDLSIVDDFACQRQVPLRQGEDSLTIVENPAPDAVNGPGKVGRYVDPEGGFAALVYNFDGGIDLVAKPIVKLKYWAPIANRLLVKLEGGTDPGKEIGIQVTEVNKWVEYSFDFSEVAGQNFKSLTIFTNAGVNAPGVVYYFDDIRFEEKTIDFLEDFEGDLTLFVSPRANNAALNGTFRVIDNPDKTGRNTTAKVGEHKKGTAPLSTLSLRSADLIDLSKTPQLNMLIWAPAGSTSVRASALSPSRGRVDITREITATEEWIEVGFNFAEFANATDVSEFELVFDAGITEPGRTYYFDQIYLSSSSVDPCEGTVVNPQIIDNFECQRNVAVTGGAANLRVVDNPAKVAPNTSAKVGEYTHSGNRYEILVYNFGADRPDLMVFNNLVVDLQAPKLAPILFKLEGSGNEADNIEVMVTPTAANTWETFRIDFGAKAGVRYERLVVFFDFDNENAVAGEKYYIDNLRFARGPVSGCIADFETANTTLFPWGDFANGGTPGTTVSVIDNPDKSGINTSAKVGQFLERGAGAGVETFAGAFFNFGAPIVLPAGSKMIKMKVWSPDTAVFVLKLEQSSAGAPGTGDIISTTPYTTKGQWQELTFDYSAFDTDAAKYQQITFIPGIKFTPAADRKIYFDDIRIGGAMCNVSSTREERRAITDLKAFPNPTSGQLFVEAPASTERLQLFDALGRQVANVAVNVGVDGGLAELDLNAQAAGFYTVVALDRTGMALARVRVAVTD